MVEVINLQVEVIMGKQVVHQDVRMDFEIKINNLFSSNLVDINHINVQIDVMVVEQVNQVQVDSMYYVNQKKSNKIRR